MPINWKDESKILPNCGFYFLERNKYYVKQWGIKVKHLYIFSLNRVKCRYDRGQRFNGFLKAPLNQLSALHPFTIYNISFFYLL